MELDRSYFNSIRLNTHRGKFYDVDAVDRLLVDIRSRADALNREIVSSRDKVAEMEKTNEALREENNELFLKGQALSQEILSLREELKAAQAGEASLIPAEEKEEAVPGEETTEEEAPWEENEEFYFLTVMNGESAGGFRKLSPSSSMKDGKLDVVAFKKMPIMEFGPLLFELINGRHPKNKNVLYFQTESLDVESPEDLVSDADGEKGAQLPIHFGVIEKRLEVFVSEKTWTYDD